MMLEFSRVLLACIYLGGGFNDFLCSPLLGEMIPFGLVQPPTRYILFIYIYMLTHLHQIFKFLVIQSTLVLQSDRPWRSLNLQEGFTLIWSN